MINNKQFIFIIGSPRSGTTWLAQVLKDHPQVAAIDYELRLFNAYLKPAINAWEIEKSNINAGKWIQGHPYIISEEEFWKWINDFVNLTYSRILEKNPLASHILDKHPGYSLATETILKVFPNAKLIHIIRDGRDVVASMLSAKERVGFGMGTAVKAAKEWSEFVSKAQKTGKEHPNNYLEIKYEQLKLEGEEVLKTILDFCELQSDSQSIKSLIEKNSIENKAVSKPDPKFEQLRKKGLKPWATELSLIERYQVEIVAGKLLKKLGYVNSLNWWVLNPLDRFKLIPFKVKSRLKIK